MVWEFPIFRKSVKCRKSRPGQGLQIGGRLFICVPCKPGLQLKVQDFNIFTCKNIRLLHASMQPFKQIIWRLQNGTTVSYASRG